MKIHFVPQGIYEDIINILGQWKILNIKDLMKMCGYDVKYYNFLYKIRKLEVHGFIKSILLGKNIKYISLAKKGLEFTRYDYTYDICDTNITHDIIVGTVLRKLLKFDFFHNGKMFHQIAFDKVLPDAEIHGGKKGNFMKDGH